jgi:predicted nucleic acid-binding protein
MNSSSKFSIHYGGGLNDVLTSILMRRGRIYEIYSFDKKNG